MGIQLGPCAAWAIDLAEIYSHLGHSMGTIFEFKINDYRTRKQAAEHCEAAMEVIESANQTFSLYIQDSEISRLNRGDLEWERASAVQQQIKKLTIQWQTETKNYFNSISPEGVYDPSGIVKTWAARNAVWFLEANGYQDFTLNAGGDVILSKKIKTPELLRVGLSNLKPIREKLAGVNMILDLAKTDYRAVATSGYAERGSHIWTQSSDFTQVSVIHNDIVTADIWATALIAGGQKAFSEVMATECQAIAIGKNRAIVSTPGFYNLLAKI